ncbi:hypothetical protein AAY81_06350 [Denitrobacterium detoxificans]|uniref:Uncharacterized protein n=1 Tax=Denitrobacterium detoxificans TaxID=79604 RepID=A0A172RYR4_9ACTN|nr:hypothetical protein [Denitrobacterium detoxificans]ANE22805.1 hypothetical protein AAY81_06350 [Denitrobacterium detoxificans]SEO76421.1 hypothetical protein SAMN02910314_01115 [Denitrobacterium detoxificans]
MLSDIKAFERVESILNEDGTIATFEKENGKILGRMMIDLCDIPDNLTVSIEPTESTYAFQGTFDFYDAALGIVIDVKSLEAKSGIWVTPQFGRCDEIAQEWIEYFIETLMKGVGEGFGVPMYAFVNDSSSFEVYPSMRA